jgi:lipid-A-disaccharide synthase
MIKVKFISLVNLIMGREVVKELIQGDLYEENLVKELDQLLHNGKRQRKLLEDYEELKDRLGNVGASEKAAVVILTALKPMKS